MIFTRFGCEVELTAYHGKHQPKGFSAPLMLVGVKYKDDSSTTFKFAHTLKADGGLNEIEAAISALPEIALEGKALKAAIKQAE